MAFRFNEQHATSLVAPLLQPGEQFLHRVRGVERPWWTFLMFRFGALFWRYYLVAATNQRLLLIRHKGLLGGYGAKSVESLSWGELDKVNLGWGVFNKDLQVSASGRRFKKTVSLGRFWMKQNFTHAQGITQSWQHGRSLPPAPGPYGALQQGPASYGAPVIQGAPQPYGQYPQN